METLRKKLNDIDIKLDEWYGCLPFEALNKIHSIDLFISTEDDIESELDELRADWHLWSIEDKADVYDSLSEQYKSFTNHIYF
jgi:hypothetical protein